MHCTPLYLPVAEPEQWDQQVSDALQGPFAGNVLHGSAVEA